MNELFPRDLTPQRQQLLRKTWSDIEKGVLRTSDLQICLLHFRQWIQRYLVLRIWKFDRSYSQNQGALWSKVLDVLTTQNLG
jgi:hypothetical protein